MSESLHENYGKKPCRVCTDFKSWMKSKKTASSSESKQSKTQENETLHVEPLTAEAPSSECPVDLTELGHGTWSLLHTMAAYYPEKPTSEQQQNMTQFMKLFSKFFPCQECGKDLQHRIKQSPPETTSQHDLSQWLCRIHNQVNKRIGKPQFDCSKVDERWKDGWKDGSCDY